MTPTHAGTNMDFQPTGYSGQTKPLPELKPCPFCGSHGDNIYVDEFWERYGQPYFVACGTCGACGPYTDRKEKAIELWNRRVRE